LRLFLLLIASHICGDLLINAAFLARAKRSEELAGRIQALALHCLVWLWLWSYEVSLKIWASMYVFVVHFLIDFFRTHLEMTLIGEELRVVPRKEALMYLLGRANDQTNVFLKNHVRTWGLLNIRDQLLHVAAIGAFVMASSMLF
jgi:hypothetical protein